MPPSWERSTGDGLASAAEDGKGWAVTSGAITGNGSGVAALS